MKQFHLYKTIIGTQTIYFYIIQKTSGLLDLLLIKNNNPFFILPMSSNTIKDYEDLGIPSISTLKNINFGFCFTIKLVTILQKTLQNNVSREGNEFIIDNISESIYHQSEPNTINNIQIAMSLRRTLQLGVLQEYVETRINDSKTDTEI